MRGEPLGDLQHRRATLADVGTGVVIPELKQFAALLLAQSQGTTGHRRLPHGGGCMADGTEYTRFTDFESRNSLGLRTGGGRVVAGPVLDPKTPALIEFRHRVPPDLLPQYTRQVFQLPEFV